MHLFSSSCSDDLGGRVVGGGAVLLMSIGHLCSPVLSDVCRSDY